MVLFLGFTWCRGHHRSVFSAAKSRPRCFAIGYKNTSYIWGPGENDVIGTFLSWFCPNCFRYIPVGQYFGQEKYWPWFWLICPVFILVTPMAFGLSMIFDHKQFKQDAQRFLARFSHKA